MLVIRQCDHFVVNNPTKSQNEFQWETNLCKGLTQLKLESILKIYKWNNNSPFCLPTTYESAVPSFPFVLLCCQLSPSVFLQWLLNWTVGLLCCYWQWLVFQVMGFHRLVFGVDYLVAGEMVSMYVLIMVWLEWRPVVFETHHLVFGVDYLVTGVLVYPQDLVMFWLESTLHWKC